MSPSKTSSEKVGIGDLRHGLTVFQFSRSEIEIILHLMQYQSATAIELRECGELSHVGPQLY